MIILYVDDSVTMQRIAEITLRGSEFQYVGARTAEDGYRLAIEHQPVLILVDADEAGYALCKRLKAERDLAGVLVIMVCGNSQPYDATRGADGMVTKPWDTQILLDKLTQLVEDGPEAVDAAPAPVVAARPAPVAAAAAQARSQTIMGMPSIKLPVGIAPPPMAAPPMAPKPVARPPSPEPEIALGAFAGASPVVAELDEDEERTGAGRVMPSVEVPEDLFGEPKPAEPEKPRYVDENVQFTVYRPKVMPPEKWHPLLAFAHLAERRPDEDDDVDPLEEVKRQAQQVLGDDAAQFTDTKQDASAAIPAEGELTIVPELAGVQVNPKARTFLWTEPVHREEFRIRAGAALDGQTVRGKVTVWLGSLIIAEVPLAIRVASGASIHDVKPAPSKARPYRKIFASYSHRDGHVVDEVSRLARALGDEYIRDWVHLRTGQVWNDQLRTLIAEADIFQLFWSQNSMRSRYCKEEWEYALSLGRPTFVRPTYWEDPMPNDPAADMPPESLVRLHFQKIRVGAAEPAPAKKDDALIDIRLMAYGAAKPSPAPGAGSLDDLPVFSAGAFHDPNAIVPPMGARRSNKGRSMTMLVLVGVLLVVLAALIAWLLLT